MSDEVPVDPTIASATSIATFDSVADRYQELFMRWPAYVETYARLADRISLPHARVLDVGCGPGNISRYLLDRRPGLTIVGFDAAPRMVELARRNVPSGTFEVGDARQLDRVAGLFDVVVLGFCLPYLCETQAARVLTAARARLVEHGVLYISVMEGDYTNSGWKESSDGAHRSYVYYYDEPWLRLQLLAAGFEIDQVTRCEYSEPRDPQASGTATIDLFVFARAVAAS